MANYASPPPDDPRSPFMNEPELAKYFGVSERTVQGWRKRSDGPPYYKIMGNVRYDRKQIDQWLRDQQVKSECTGCAA
jgi:predicted DNA-binding transcriptional regulator AlpA